MSNVFAIIIAAGRGSRLRPFTDHAPKCLLSFAGRRLIDWQLASLRANGIERIGIVRGYLKDTLSGLGLPHWDNQRWSETNMVYSLLCARDALITADTVLVAYADIVYEPKIIASLLRARDDISITVDRDWLALWRIRFSDPLSDAESLRMGRDKEILDIGRKVSSFDDIEAQYMGLLKFTAKGIRAFLDFCDNKLGRGVEKAAMTDVLAELVRAGTAVRGVEVSGGWLEFDCSTDVSAYEKLRESGQLSRHFSTAAVIS